MQTFPLDTLLMGLGEVPWRRPAPISSGRQEERSALPEGVSPLLSKHVEELRNILNIGDESIQSLTLEQQLKIDALIWKHAEDLVGIGVPLDDKQRECRCRN